MQDNVSSDVVVIGAGIVGVCCALELQRRGLSVQLIDRKSPGQETSYGNAGVLARSSLIAFNNPTVWAGLPRFISNRTAQFRYNPVYIMRQSRWAIKFLSRARKSTFNETAVALDSLIRLSIPEHRRLANAAGVVHRLHEEGWIFLYRNQQAFEASRFTRDVLDHFGVGKQELNSLELSELEPSLRPIFPHALWVKDACSVDNPGQVVAAYSTLFQATGGSILRDEVRNLVPASDGRWHLFGQSGSKIHADRVVVALGPWANDLLAPLGQTAPIAFERGYHRMFSADTTGSLRRPVYDTAGGYVLAPMEEGLRLSTGVELNYQDAPANLAQLNMAEASARAAFPLLRPLGDHWLGCRPTLPDSRPLIGQSPRHPQLWLAIGHQHIGFNTGPGTAQILADLMLGGKCGVDPWPFRPERFLS